MAVELNEQVLVLSLGSSGLCVVICAAVCCCRDFVRRSRLRELAAEPAEDREEPEQGLARVLITGYQAPIRRLDPFAFRKTKLRGNNAQANYEKVTSAGEDQMDRLVRAYGSLAAEIDPEDRLKLLVPSTRRKESAQAAIEKGARILEVESGEAPSRQPESKKSLPRLPQQSRVRADESKEQAAQAPRTPAASAPRQSKPEGRIPPQVLGRPGEVAGASGKPLDASVSEMLLQHIELPAPSPPATPAPPAPAPVAAAAPPTAPDAAAAASLEALQIPPAPSEGNEPSESREREDKFEALDAELNEQLNQSVCLALDTKALHKSVAGLPRSGQGSRTKMKAKGRSKSAASPEAT